MSELLNLSLSTETLHVDITNLIDADVNLPWALLALTVVLVARGAARAIREANRLRLEAEQAELEQPGPILGVVQPFDWDDDHER